MATPARSSRSHPNHGSPLSWTFLATVRAAVIAMAVFIPGKTMGQLVVVGDNGDLIDRSGLVMSTTVDSRMFSVEINQLPLISNRDESNIRKVKDLVKDLVMYNSDTNRQFQANDMDLAFINCDTSNGNNATETFLRAIAQTPQPYCVIFYTVEHDWCDYYPQGNSFNLVFTTLDRDSANDFQLLMNNTGELTVTINYNQTVDEEPSGGQRNADSLSSNQNNSVLGPSPSTSVALIILYSITGVITALFLLIIMIGAIRAHRHPERYGPRATTRFGRPRQSRAKGLARAVLDTLPIVRFGDQPAPATKDEVVKQTDMEMQTDSVTSRISGENDEDRRSAVASMASQKTSGGAEIVAVAPTVVANDAEEQRGEAMGEQVMSTAEMDPSQLRCPVCMEDFESGQDLRVLPCHHSFHPDCIDPWLLNVAGSCPLCRIDLRPEDQRQSLELPPPPPEPEQSGSRFMRYLDTARGTSGEERMAALRQLREENRNRPRSRAPELGISRLRRVFHRRMSGSRVSEVSGSEVSPSVAPSITDATGGTTPNTVGAETARGGEGLATISSIDIRERTDGGNAGNQQPTQQ